MRQGFWHLAQGCQKAGCEQWVSNQHPFSGNQTPLPPSYPVNTRWAFCHLNISNRILRYHSMPLCCAENMGENGTVCERVSFTSVHSPTNPSQPLVIVILLAGRLAATTRLFLLWKRLSQRPHRHRAPRSWMAETWAMHRNHFFPQNNKCARYSWCTPKPRYRPKAKWRYFSYIFAQNWQRQYDSNFFQLHCSIFICDSEPGDWKLALVSDG